MSQHFRALRVYKEGERITRQLETLTLDALPAGELTIEVAYSSLNYKDALSAAGHPGVTKHYPHTPGIDASGTVRHSTSSAFSQGDEVIVTGFDLGANTPGGYSELIRVPAAWALPKPAGLSLREAMIIGTAGLTAALSVDALLRLADVQGPVLVTGASGNVGSVAVALLAKLGYQVSASTGKKSAHKVLRALGASDIIERQTLAQATAKPLASSRWGAAVDTVGGHTLENVIKSLRPRGAVAACGNVGGPELHLSVYPFILRGVSLVGIDSANCPVDTRQRLWRQLAEGWKLEGLERAVNEIRLDELDGALEQLLAGNLSGRTIVKVAA